MTSRTYLSIGDVLTLLREEFPDVTISKIRFLESQGLVNPERSPSGYRKFFDHDVERLRWVLRQQREHFLPLKVIRDRAGRRGSGRRAGSRTTERQAGPLPSPSPAPRRPTPPPTPTPTSSRPRPTRRRWPASSPMRRAAPPSSPTRHSPGGGCRWSRGLRDRSAPAADVAADRQPPVAEAARRTAAERRSDAAASAGGCVHPHPRLRRPAAPADATGPRCADRIKVRRRRRRAGTRRGCHAQGPGAGRRRRRRCRRCCQRVERSRGHRHGCQPVGRRAVRGQRPVTR